MTYIRFFFVLYWFVPFLKFELLPSESPRCTPAFKVASSVLDKAFTKVSSYQKLTTKTRRKCPVLKVI